jgi:hypothetical protein
VPKYGSGVEIGAIATSGASPLGLQEQAVFWTGPGAIPPRTVNTHYSEILMRRRLDNGVKYGCFLGVNPMRSGALRLGIVTYAVLASSRNMMLSAARIACPHRQQLRLRHYGQQDVVLVTNHNYETETTGVTATIWVQGGVAPYAFVRTRFSLIGN